MNVCIANIDEAARKYNTDERLVVVCVSAFKGLGRQLLVSISVFQSACIIIIVCFTLLNINFNLIKMTEKYSFLWFVSAYKSSPFKYLLAFTSRS